jgi:hypothetical protein
VKPPDQYGDTVDAVHAHFHMEDYVDMCLHGSKVHLQGDPITSFAPAHHLLVRKRRVMHGWGALKICLLV